MEQMMGVEPTTPAWKAGVLPLNYTCTKERLVLFVRVTYLKTKESVLSIKPYTPNILLGTLSHCGTSIALLPVEFEPLTVARRFLLTTTNKKP